MDLKKYLFPLENPRHSNKWISGKELIERWGIIGFELFDFMKQGLQAYTRYGKKIIDSDSLKKAPRYTLDQMEALIRGTIPTYRVLGKPGRFQREPTEWEIKAEAREAYKAQPLEIVNPPKDSKLISFTIPEDEKKAEEVILKAKSFLFKMEEVLSFEREHGLVSREFQADPSLSAIRPSQDDRGNGVENRETKAQIEEEPTVSAKITSQQTAPLSEYPQKNYFKKAGDYWKIEYEGREDTIGNLLGLQYIAYLLERPGESVSCINLYHAANPSDSPTITKERAAAEGLPIAIRSREVEAINTLQAKKELGKKYRQLQSDSEQAESDIEKNEIEEEMDAIMKSLKNDRFPDPINSKAQVNVKKSINRAKAAIGHRKLKTLTSYLNDNIKPDGKYGYIYTGAPWEITL